MPVLLTKVKSKLFLVARRKTWGLLDGEYASVFRGRSLRPPQVVTKRPCEQGLFFASYRRECVEVVID